MAKSIDHTMHKDLIVFGEDWGGLPSSTQQLIGQLSHDRNILWVNSIGLRQPRLRKQDIKRLCLKVLARARTLLTKSHSKSEPQRHFTVISPLTLPAPKGRFARYIATVLLKYQLQASIKRQQLVRPILWISLPTAVDIIGHLDESAVVYYCCDDFSALEGVDHHTVSQREQQLAACANLILTSSHVLNAKFKAKKVFTIEHGVDYQLFATQTPRAIDLPCHKPIAGYYGSISNWLDFALLAQTIAQLPHWNFVFIGDINVDVSLLRQYANVYFLGPKAHQQLPQYCQYWQVSLLPFRQNRQIKACNPFKLREYLATGKPIVSTDFPALAPYASLINVVNNAQEMVAALHASLVEQPIDVRKQQAVIKQTWQARATQVSHLLEQL